MLLLLRLVFGCLSDPTHVVVGRCVLHEPPSLLEEAHVRLKFSDNLVGLPLERKDVPLNDPETSQGVLCACLCDSRRRLFFRIGAVRLTYKWWWLWQLRSASSEFLTLRRGGGCRQLRLRLRGLLFQSDRLSRLRLLLRSSCHWSRLGGG